MSSLDALSGAAGDATGAGDSAQTFKATHTRTS